MIKLIGSCVFLVTGISFTFFSQPEVLSTSSPGSVGFSSSSSYETFDGINLGLSFQYPANWIMFEAGFDPVFMKDFEGVVSFDIVNDNDHSKQGNEGILAGDSGLVNPNLSIVSLRSPYRHIVRKMLLEGKRISAADYIKSLRTVKEIKSEFLAMFSNRKFDAIVVPSTIVPAPRVVDNIVWVGKNVVLETRQALLRNTIVFNSTGLPAISIPIGFTNSNMPVGVQIVGPPFKEEIILSIAYCYEQISSSMNTFVPRLH
ncbi:MAG: amidase family protein [Nitrososphaeraceae archaeon]